MFGHELHIYHLNIRHIPFEKTCLHGGNTKIPTCAVDLVHTGQNGCQPRITAFDHAITVNDSSDIDCLSRLYGCQWTQSTTGFARMVYDWFGQQHR